MHGQHHPLLLHRQKQMPHQGGAILALNMDYPVGFLFQFPLLYAAIGHDFPIRAILPLQILFAYQLRLLPVQRRPHHPAVKGIGYALGYQQRRGSRPASTEQ